MPVSPHPLDADPGGVVRRVVWMTGGVCRRSVMPEMSESSARIRMHRPTYSLTVGSIPQSVIDDFVYRLVGNQIADYAFCGNDQLRGRGGTYHPGYGAGHALVDGLLAWPRKSWAMAVRRFS